MTAPEALRALVARAIEERVTPGAVIEVGDARETAWTLVAGRHTYAAASPPVTPDTVYDLASLTKVLATTTLALRAHAAGRLRLDAPVASHIPAFALRPAITVADLLEHAAGFPAHRPYYRAIAGRPAFVERIAAEPSAYPPRTRHEYTDLGFMLLGALLEEVSATPLERLFATFVDDAMPEAEIRYGAPVPWRPRVAPSGLDPWRGRLMASQVHDGNAAALGGAAGHAGLFGTAGAVGTFARWWLGLWRGDVPASAGVSHALAARASAPGTVPGSSRGLGWDTMLPTSSCGTRLSTASIGHTGFTGTSLWIDPVRELYVVLLTNRVHAADDVDGIRRLRIAVHDAVADAWDGSMPG